MDRSYLGQTKSKLKAENRHGPHTVAKSGISDQIYSNYIILLNSHTYEYFTFTELPRSVFIYVCICMYIDICIYIYTCIYIYIYIFVCMHIYLNIYIHICVDMYKYTYVVGSTDLILVYIMYTHIPYSMLLVQLKFIYIYICT